ncbi:MAG TPA: substrate-binding domain-containing protein, partial [Solirubrobacteraceae bacterium]|nr:substrate-binding domain-containing protein [Solirubrobacteraceae bacterium]
MTFFSARRWFACIVPAAAVVAFAAMPGTAMAEGERDAQCAGSNIVMNGSSLQASAQVGTWNPDFNTAANTFACSGEKKPKVEYSQTEANKGSGACLKAFGIAHAPSFNEYPTCGTDEAPNETAKGEVESHNDGEAGYEAKSLESIPVLQGALAIMVHLPKGCKAEATIPAPAGKKVKLGRLALDNETIDKIYRGQITTWKGVEEAQGAGHGEDKVKCEVAAEAEDTIHPVVRADKSGTTHIFKAYLEQVDTAENIKMEEFENPQGKGKVCTGARTKGEEKSWANVAEGCENQRWPEGIEASKIRPVVTGNPGVIKEVEANESSFGYGDLAQVRSETGGFSKKGVGGENKKGSETKVGEQLTKFWAEVQDTEPGLTPVGYADPSSTGDVEKPANSNCAGTVYAAKPGEKFPPKSTRETWFAVKAELTQKKYNI